MTNLSDPRISESKNSFFGGAQLTALASNIGHIFLFNPEDSGIVVYVDVIYGWSASTNGAVDLTHITSDPGGFSLGGTPKILGAADAGASFKFINNATMLGSAVYTDIATVNGIYLVGGTPKSSPVELTEGNGIALAGDLVNVETSGFMEWREFDA